MMKFLSFSCLLFLCLSYFPAGLSAAEQGAYHVVLPPVFVPEKTSSGKIKYINVQDIEAAVRAASPKLKHFFYNHKRNTFIVPDSRWVLDLLESFNQLMRSAGIRAEAETWDCENYSGLLSSYATVRLWNAGYLDSHSAIGWMRVFAKQPWANIPSGTHHALMFAVTNNDIYVIEPQNGHYITLKKYPNREFIEEVYLF